MSTQSAAGIYVITNVVTGRKYVGSAANLTKRMARHRQDLTTDRHANRSLQAAWNKYGPAAFTFAVLECVAERTALIAREQHWIDTLRVASKEHGYNLAPYAGSSLGVTHTEQTRAKMSAVRLGRPLSPDHIAKAAAGRRGLKHSPETRAKMSLAHKGRPMHPNTRAAIAKAMIGRHPSAEERARLSAGQTGIVRLGQYHPPVPLDVRAKMSASHKARHRQSSV